MCKKWNAQHEVSQLRWASGGDCAHERAALGHTGVSAVEEL